MSTNPTDLPWLLAAPGDFRAQVRALAGPESAAKARQLALHRLDLNQLHTLGRALTGIIARDTIKTTKLGVLSNGTIDLMLPAFAVSALRHGVWLENLGSAFDQAAQQALDPASDCWHSTIAACRSPRPPAIPSAPAASSIRRYGMSKRCAAGCAAPPAAR